MERSCEQPKYTGREGGSTCRQGFRPRGIAKPGYGAADLAAQGCTRLCLGLGLGPDRCWWWWQRQHKQQRWLHRHRFYFSGLSPQTGTASTLARNTVNKLLQNESVHVAIVINHFGEFSKFLSEFKFQRFENNSIAKKVFIVFTNNLKIVTCNEKNTIFIWSCRWANWEGRELEN